MNLLLMKELRLVLPASLLVVVSAWVLGLVSQSRLQIDLAPFAVATLFAGAAGIAALGFGQELEQQTLVLQLSVPVSRRRIWWTKTLVLLAALVPFYISLRYFATTTNQPQPFAIWLLQTAALVSFLTLLLRSIVGGAVIGGVFSAIWSGYMEPLLWSKLVARVSEAEAFSENGRIILAAAITGSVTWWNYRLWSRAEIRNRFSTENGIHTWRLLAIAPTPHRTKPLLNLLVKELRLQSPALVVAVPCIILALVLSAIRPLLPGSMQLLQPQWIGIYLLISIVPLIVGSMAFAEERSLQSFQSVAALPRKRLTLFAFKAFAGCSLALVAGFLVPLGLEAAFQTKELNGPVLFNAVYFTWALSFFASSFSTGTVRAVLAASGFGTVWLATFSLLVVASIDRLKTPMGLLSGWVMDSFPSLSLGASGLRWIVPALAWTYALSMAATLLILSYRLSKQPQPSRLETRPALRRLMGVHIVWAIVIVDVVKALQTRMQ